MLESGELDDGGAIRALERFVGTRVKAGVAGFSRSGRLLDGGDFVGVLRRVAWRREVPVDQDGRRGELHRIAVLELEGQRPDGRGRIFVSEKAFLEAEERREVRQRAVGVRLDGMHVVVAGTDPAGDTVPET